MFKHIVVMILSLLLLLSSFGCYTMNQVGTSTGTKMEMTNSASAAASAKFTRTKQVNHFLFGLVSPDDVGFEQLVTDAVKSQGGTSAVNVRIRYQQTFVNGFIGAITLGIYTPFTLTVEGDVVK